MKELLGALLHWPSLMVIVAATVACSIPSPFGLVLVKAEVVAAAVFQVAGTMVALTLPAAQLSNGLIVQMREQVVELARVFHDDRGAYARASIVLDEMISELKARIALAWRAVAYAFCSFILASVALLDPAIRPPADADVVRALDDFVASAALMSLVVGSFWFLPIARYLFGLQHLDMMRETVRTLFESPENPVAAPVPPAPDGAGAAPGVTP